MVFAAAQRAQGQFSTEGYELTRRRFAGLACRRARRLLAGAPLFGQLPSEVLQGVAARVHVKRVARSGFVFVEGEPARSLNVLAEGRVKAVRETDEGQEVILRLIQPSDIFGGASGWGEPTYPATARAQDPY